MAVRGDEVASAIEAHVREAIEKMVGEIRSSVEDVRDAVDQQLKAALQSVQADVNAISFVPFIQKSIGEISRSRGSPQIKKASAAKSSNSFESSTSSDCRKPFNRRLNWRRNCKTQVRCWKRSARD